MDAALKGDTRPGEIVGILDRKPAKDAATIDAIRQRELTVIGWFILRPAHGFSGLRHVTDVPIISNELGICGPDDTTSDIATDRNVYLGYLTSTKIKTLVAVGDFSDLDNTDPTAGLDLGEDKPRSTQPTRASAVYEAKQMVGELRARGIRLCIISLDKPPLPELLAYVKESGGIVLYPNGIPADQAANELKTAVTK